MGRDSSRRDLSFHLWVLSMETIVESQVFPVFRIHVLPVPAVARLQDGGAIGHQRNTISQNQRHQQFRRQGDILQGIASPTDDEG